MSLPSNITILDQLAADDSGFSVENQDLVRALSDAEDAHFWHLARNAFILDRLRRLGANAPSHFLDLGCGGGCVSAAVSAAGYDVVGIDGHLPRVVEAARRAPAASFLVHDLRLGLDVPIGAPFDAVGLFDVIEHLDDPVGALDLALRQLKPGGWLVGTVPALMSLWSEVDVLAGHRIRFDARTLTETLSKVKGARIVDVESFNRLLVLPMWLRRRKAAPASAADQQSSDLDIPPAWLNRLMYLSLRAEYASGAILRGLRIPGASLWFSMQKLGA